MTGITAAWRHHAAPAVIPRFWHKFLYDIGVVPTKEPYAKRTSHGMILGEGGEKMSKSRGNVVNPNDIVAQYGADTMRLHIMFIGDFEKAVSWSNEAVKGSKRFLDRCFNLQDIATAEESISAKNESIVHKTIKKVSQDIDELKMNTAIAAMMTMVNEFYANGCSKGDVEMLCLLLSPFAPHGGGDVGEHGLCRQVRQDGHADGLAGARRVQDCGQPRGDGRAGQRQAEGYRHRPRGQRRGCCGGRRYGER